MSSKRPSAASRTALADATADTAPATIVNTIAAKPSSEASVSAPSNNPEKGKLKDAAPQVMQLVGARGSFGWSVEGVNNRIVHRGDYFMNNVDFRIIGDNNKVSIGKGAHLHELKIFIRGNNNTIAIGRKSRIKGNLMIRSKEPCKITIGNGTTAGDIYILAMEGRNVEIGNNCMISYQVTVRNSDAHSVTDMDTGLRVNPAADVVVGNNVWLAAGCKVLKGSVVPDGSIVAASALVTKAFDTPNVVLAGNPAKVLRERKSWDRRLLAEQVEEDREMAADQEFALLD
jgi:acetyltransferase-like isoleucine patch superfamily enzyme